jgi:hypothetical protein
MDGDKRNILKSRKFMGHSPLKRLENGNLLWYNRFQTSVEENTGD